MKTMWSLFGASATCVALRAILVNRLMVVYLSEERSWHRELTVLAATLLVAGFIAGVWAIWGETKPKWVRLLKTLGLGAAVFLAGGFVLNEIWG
jgi:hypothetical protein